MLTKSSPPKSNTPLNPLLIEGRQKAPTSLPVRDRTQTGALEKQIDEMLYVIYGLTPEEIALVEGKG